MKNNAGAREEKKRKNRGRKRRSEGDVPTVKCLMNYDKWADIYIILWHPFSSFFSIFNALLGWLQWLDFNGGAHTSEEVLLYSNYILMCFYVTKSSYAYTVITFSSPPLRSVYIAIIIARIYSRVILAYMQSMELAKLNFLNFLKCVQPMHDTFMWLAKIVKMHLWSDPWCRPPK